MELFAVCRAGVEDQPGDRQLQRRHRSVEFRKFLDTIESQVPARAGCTPHRRQLRHSQNRYHPEVVRQALPLSRSLHAHLWFVDQPGRTLVRRTHQQADSPWRVSQREGLEAAIRQYIEVHNEDLTPFIWTRTADQILASIARYAQRTTRLISRTIGTGD